MSATDDLVRPLAEEYLGVTLVAGAFFRADWHDRYGGGGGAIGLTLFIIGRLRRDRIKKPPRQPYVAVGPHEVAVLDIAFGPPRIERPPVGWPRHELTAKVRPGNQYSCDLRLPRYTLFLEAMKYDEQSAAVVAALSESIP